MKKFILPLFSITFFLSAHTVLAANDEAPFVNSLENYFIQIVDTDHILGATDAEVSIVVYSDFECPFCKRHHSVLKALKQEYQGKVNIVYRNFPMSFHGYAYSTALAAECVATQAGNDAYFAFVDSIFSQDIAEVDLNKEAKKVGLNESSFTSCIQSDNEAISNEEAIIDRHLRQADRYSIYAVPSNLIVDNSVRMTLDQMTNATVITGSQPIETFRTVIDAIIAPSSKITINTPEVRTLPSKKPVTTTRPTLEKRLCKRMERFTNNSTTFKRVNNRIEKRFGFRCS